MRFALRIWFLSAILEAVIYTIIYFPVGIITLPYALVGGLPGFFVFNFLLNIIDFKMPIGKAKWVALIVAQFACANATLLLFLYVLDLPILQNNLLYVWILNLAVSLAFILSIKLAKQTYFTKPIHLIDLDETESIFTIKHATDEN